MKNLQFEFAACKNKEEKRLKEIDNLIKDTRINEETRKWLGVEKYATEKVLEMIDELQTRTNLFYNDHIDNTLYINPDLFIKKEDIE